MILIFFPILIFSIAIYTYAERKGLASVQKRKGPNIVGFFGLGQPFADGIKLFLKEHIFPYRADQFIFFVSPAIVFLFSLVSWLFIPIFSFGSILNSNVGLLFIFAFSSLSSYGIILAGWASNSQYAMLGSLRATAQFLSYEIVLSLTLLPIIFMSNSLILSEIIWAQFWQGYYIISLFPSFILFLITAVAETNRPPFDLPEAEAELVAGYFVEYSAMSFALFFLAEYAHMILMGHLITIIFFAGWSDLVYLFYQSLNLINSNVDYNLIWSIFFSIINMWIIFIYIIKLYIVLFYFVWLRASFPRFRYDQLMTLGWKTLLPITLAWSVYVILFLWVFSFYQGISTVVW